MRIEEQVNEGIKNAMKAKDKVTLETLRNIKKYILEAKTTGPEITELSDADCLKIIQKLAKQGTDSATIYQQQNRNDLYTYEIAQVNVLQQFLPKQLSDSELTESVKAIITQCGATSLQEIGKVMGLATQQLAGKADGKLISAKVKELLN